MNSSIPDFIKEHNVASIACLEGDKPYCFNCFYAVIEQEFCLVFKSPFSTKHAKLLERNGNVAGTIAAEQLNPALIKGLQFEGVVVKEAMDISLKASAAYYMRYPMALAIPGKLWVVRITAAKLTDYSKGMGYTEEWSGE